MLQIRGVSLHAPAGWKPASNKLGDLAQSAYDSRESASVGLYSVPWLNPNEGLRLLTKAVVQMNTYTGKPTVHEPVNINGVDCYHVTGRYPGRQVEDQFGAIYERDQVSFSFTFDDDVSRPARQKIIDSVLATVFWR